MSTQPRLQMPGASWLRTRAPWVVLGILLVSGIGSAAYAFWQSISSSNFAVAVGDTVLPGGKPSASLTGAAITVSWPAVSTSGGHAVTGYTVARYDSATGGSKTPGTGTCAGTVAVLSCAEQNVPGGTWYYTVTPAIALWNGAESPRSDGVSSDVTPPVASVASISPTPNAAGFNNSSPVIVNLTAQDTGGSGVASITYAVDSGGPTTVNAANAPVSVSGDGTHVVSYFATDNAGNASASQNLAIKIDTVAPGTPSIIVPTYVNTANVSDVPVTGTAEPGSTLTVTVTDAGTAHTVSQTVTASGTGTWAAAGLNLTSLNQGAATYNAKAADAAGNTGSTVTVTSIKDTLAPAAPTITAPPYVNFANVANVPVSGTAEAGAAVTLLVTDAGTVHTVTKNAATNGTGAWSVTGLNLTSLDDGAVAYTAMATDAAGNTGTSAAVTRTKDTVVPGLPTLTVPAFVNAANVANVPVNGTAEPGAIVALTVTDPGTAHTVPQNATANGSGAWSATALNLTTLNPGTVTYRVTATDAAGNASGTVTTTNTKDTVSVTPVVTPPPAVNATNVGNVIVNGTSEAGASVTLTVTDVDSAHSISPTATANGSGAWSVTLDLSTFTDGTISYSARGTDPAGNVSAAGIATSAKEALAPTVTGVELKNGGVAGTAETGDSVTITYSERMDASKFCAAWDNAGTGLQSLNKNNDGVIVTLQDNGSNDTLTVTSTGCNTALKIGPVNLGGDYVSATATFQRNTGTATRSTVEWDPTSFRLTIVLGTKATGTVLPGVPAGFPSYTPAPGLLDMASKPLVTTPPFTSASTSRF